jgi:hypothetical protein
METRMAKVVRKIRLVVFWAVAISCSVLVRAEVGPRFKRLAKDRVDPKEFGIQDDTITVIPATSFFAVSGSFGGVGTQLSGSFGRSAFPPDTVEYYAPLDIPAGSVIDFIGLNSLTDTDYILGLELDERDGDGNVIPYVSFSVPSHNYWQTDFYGPIVQWIFSRDDKEYMIHVEQAGNQTMEWFGYVSVHWHRNVSPAPATATFNDVPTSDPAFQFIEALAASGVTTGCGGGNFCPDAPLTRRQMAVFLSKALGLHWPN